MPGSVSKKKVGNENKGETLWTDKNVHVTNPFRGIVKGSYNYKTNNAFP